MMSCVLFVVASFTCYVRRVGEFGRFPSADQTPIKMLPRNDPNVRALLIVARFSLSCKEHVSLLAPA